MNQYGYNLKHSFEQVVGRHSKRIALTYEDPKDNLSYQHLDELSNQLASCFLARGIKKNDVVAIANGKKSSTFVAMIACLKIGAVYTNIDEDNPLSRTQKILAACQPALLFCESMQGADLISFCQKSDLPVMHFNLAEIKNYSTDPIILMPDITGSCPAYIMFTSGSTGTPKGVVISHGNLLSFIGWSIDRFAVTPDDIFANVSPIYFDNSVFDIYTCLFSGATLAPIDKSITKQPLKLVNLINELKCTVWFSVPSLLIYLNTFKVLTKDAFKDIRSISFGGEGFPKTELKKIYDKYSSKIQFTNVYGPTEATCICASYDVSDKDFTDLNGILPLGFINPNVDYLILNEQGDNVSVGETAQLCLLGPNIGLGYYGDVEKTQQHFTANPLARNFTGIMYQTGDLVYQDKVDNMLYFVGRVDNQIKHLGYRIELDEIEHAINSLSYVLQCAVVYKRINNIFGKIFAYVVAQEEQGRLSRQGLNEQMLCEDLKNILPIYMIPNDIIFLDALPKNSNGKIDRLTLNK